MADGAKVWGYILDMPGRPPLAKQRITLNAMGVDLCSAWHDKITKGSTRPQKQLVRRLSLLEAVSHGDIVVVAAPLCLGVSGKDADWFLAELQERGVEVIVNGDLVRIGPQDDRSEMVDRVTRQHKGHHVRMAKRRTRERETK